MNNLVWLENWFRQNCNGDWEHFHGVNIGTLDNPGWYVKIDLKETDYANKQVQELNQNIDNNNWITCSISGGVFRGYGDTLKLETIIGVFRNWISA